MSDEPNNTDDAPRDGQNGTAEQPAKRRYTRRAAAAAPAPVIDPELAALMSCCSAIEPLDDDARTRVLDYLSARYDRTNLGDGTREQVMGIDLSGTVRDAPTDPHLSAKARRSLSDLPQASIEHIEAPPALSPEDAERKRIMDNALIRALEQGGSVNVGGDFNTGHAESLVAAGLAGWPSANARNAIVLSADGARHATMLRAERGAALAPTLLPHEGDIDDPGDPAGPPHPAQRPVNPFAAGL